MAGPTAPQDRGVLSTVSILIVYSLALAALKFWMSHVTSSEAIESDGWNNLADGVYSILIGIGFLIALQPADESHPHGHRRFESILGMAVGIVILWTGVQILVECWKRFTSPPEMSPNAWVAAGLFALMLSKLWIAALCRRVGVRDGRPALVAIANDQRMDVFATLSALIGYGGGLRWSPKFDVVFGGLISIWVFKIGIETMRDHIDQLTGRSAPPEVIEAIRKTVDESPALFGMNDLRTHYVGPEIEAAFNVFAHKRLPLEDVHAAEEDLKVRILKIPGVSNVFIHIEPHENSK